ncbi:MAG: hypothetical protein KDD23_06205 [Winogradskyella sp.]|uniref:hypothetical protein n=1 Tax=Mariniflexile maritimum TaxID=2682493 RepID=UPI0012F66F3E|nr:hypothetical protein [Mariniflexile maritimum]MCB0388283.1 hypothetical protein [Winogradskyella sp.]
MDTILVILFLLFICFIIGAIVLFAFRLLFKKPKTELQNPYIREHLNKKANDKAYQEYNEWLKKTGQDKEVNKKF